MWWEVCVCVRRPAYKGFASLLPLAFGCPHSSGVGATRLLQLSSRIREGGSLREALRCFMDVKSWYWACTLSDIVLLELRLLLLLNASATLTLGTPESRGKKNPTCFLCPLKNN